MITKLLRSIFSNAELFQNLNIILNIFSNLKSIIFLYRHKSYISKVLIKLRSCVVFPSSQYVSFSVEITILNLIFKKQVCRFLPQCKLIIITYCDCSDYFRSSQLRIWLMINDEGDCRKVVTFFYLWIQK